MEQTNRECEYVWDVVPKIKWRHVNLFLQQTIIRLYELQNPLSCPCGHIILRIENSKLRISQIDRGEIQEYDERLSLIILNYCE